MKRFLSCLLSLFSYSMILSAVLPAPKCLAEAKTSLQVEVKRTTVLTDQDATRFVMSFFYQYNRPTMQGFLTPSKSLSIMLSEGQDGSVVITSTKNGFGGADAEALSKLLRGQSFRSEDGNLIISCGRATIFPTANEQPSKTEVPFCNLLQK